MTTGHGPGAIWLIIVAVGVGTYALRLSFILLLGRLDEVPPRVAGVLRFVPAAVLAALVVPAVVSLSIEPAPALQFDSAKLVAGSVAALVAWRTENVLATIGVGMIVLWVVRLVVP